MIIEKNIYKFITHIVNNLFPLNEYQEGEIKLLMNKFKQEAEDLNIEIACDSHYSSGKIKSLVLDVFDFNLNKFSSEYLKDYDIENDIKNQLEEKPWLVKDRMKDLILI